LAPAEQIPNKERSRHGHQRRFDPEVVARYCARDRRRLLADPGIVRNRLKVEAAIANAARILVGEFLMSIGYLSGAHVESCPVHRRILKLRPPWSRGSTRGATR
jgi:DNA-3-methyladenine glycosylase I